jgi:hypothetical protein
MEPTPYPDVNQALNDLLASTQAILDQRFCGMYLSGSLALGDFDPRSSDIDYVVVTDAALDDDQFGALQAMHAGFNRSDSPWATEVEVIYLPLEALRRYDPARTRYPHIQRGGDQVLEMDDLDGGWAIHAAILREHGMTVAGTPVRPLIDPIEPDDLRRAMVSLMEVWWGPMRYDPAPLQRSGYQIYTVSTMCRILYTMEIGAVASKPAAARWARQTLGERWAGLIERALTWQKDLQEPLGEDVREIPQPLWLRRAHALALHEPLDEDVRESLDLIHYTLERCRAWDRPVCADVRVKPARDSDGSA